MQTYQINDYIKQTYYRAETLELLVKELTTNTNVEPETDLRIINGILYIDLRFNELDNPQLIIDILTLTSTIESTNYINVKYPIFKYDGIKVVILSERGINNV